MPLLKELPEELSDSEIVGRDFFRSAGNLCRLYGLALSDYSRVPYPQNIALAYSELSQRVSAMDEQLSLRLISMENSKACLISVKQFDTGNTLFYLPVEPLHRLLSQKEHQAVAELLLSICCYLYQLGGISYHTEDDSYLAYVYDMVSEWGEEAEYFGDSTEQERFKTEVSRIKEAATALLCRISDPSELQALKARQERFNPKDEAEINLKNIAGRVCRLIERFPDRSIMDSVYYGLCIAYCDERAVSADQYLSFLWSSRDVLYDQLMEAVNAELNELSYIDEPVSIQFFDAPQEKISHDLSFETEFFDLLHEICDTLNDFDHEKYHPHT